MSRNEPDVLLVYAVVYGVPLAFLVLRGWTLARIRKAVSEGTDLPAIAAALRGEMARDPSFEGPFVRFTLDGVRCYCHQRMLNRTQGVVITTLEARSGFPGFLQATSKGAIRHPLRSPRFRSPARIAGFSLVTTDVEWSSTLLQSGLEEYLNGLRTSVLRSPRIQLAGDRLTLEVEERVTRPRIVELLGYLAPLIRLSRREMESTGITFVGEIAVANDGCCPVCRQHFGEPGIRCSQCGAPHHPDCWSYVGRCAIFGCSSRRAA
ncbi:MAG TPA: hypothetical protein VKW04_13830 [Planctomycetota bacterium]|nr:hypothetical protein [Planctomycetota bacterium]